MREGRILGAGDGEGRTRERMARTAANANRVRYQRETDNRDRQIAAANRRIGELERYARAADRGSDLQALVAQGYQLDVAEELEDCVDMPQSQYDRHVARIMERYVRDPLDQPPIEPARNENNHGDPGADDNGLTADDAIQISRYVRSEQAKDPNKEHSELINDYIKRKLDRFRTGGPRIA
jgi:hypothetical protein